MANPTNTTWWRDNGGCGERQKWARGPVRDSLQTPRQLAPGEAPSILGFALGGMSCNKLGDGTVREGALPSPGTGLTRQKWDDSWSPAWQFTQQRTNSPAAEISVGTAQGVSFCSTSSRRLYCELVMIIYSRFILSLSLLSKYERSGQNSTSVSHRPYFNAEFSQKPVNLLL